MSDGAQYVTRDGLLYDGGKRAADAEWVAAIRKRDANCNGPSWLVTGNGEHECPGCLPLRALLKRAMASGT